MIKVTVEIWPYGYKEAKREIATLNIINDGTGTKELGNYTCVWESDNLQKYELKGIPRGREHLPNLIASALYKFVPTQKETTKPLCRPDGGRDGSGVMF